jgi:NitT/TauT family transport system substrate-binding protein
MTPKVSLPLIIAALCFAFASLWSGFPQNEPLKLAVGPRLGAEALAFCLSTPEAEHLRSSIRTIEMSGVTSVERALENGVVDAAILSLDEALQMNDGDTTVQLVKAMEISTGGDRMIASTRIQSINDLRNSSIGVEIRSCNHYFLHQILKRAGLSLNDINLIPITSSEIRDARGRARFDAILVTDPEAITLENSDAHVLFDSSQLTPPIVRILVVRSSSLTPHREKLADLIRLIDSIAPGLTSENPAFVSFLERRTGLSTTNVIRILNRTTFCSDIGADFLIQNQPLAAIIAETETNLKEAGLISEFSSGLKIVQP